MLRKRTTFKPNLKQVSPQTTVGKQTNALATTVINSSTESACNVGQLPTPEKHAEDPQISASTSHKTINLPESLINSQDAVKDSEVCNKTKEIDDLAARQVSEKQVQDAITQLAGQKFEPMKSLSLRSSANKNVKIKDLLFYNPPMTKDQKRYKKSLSTAKRNGQKKAEEDEIARSSQESEEPANDKDLEHNSLVPKVKMGPGGKLILDESSTIINRKNSIKEQEAIFEDHEDVISKTNYDSYRRKSTPTSQTKWSLDDTKKFYHALRILGTDFSLMESLLFPGLRSRTELHKKFKREERTNKNKIDIALSNRLSLDSEDLEDLKEIFYQ